MIIELIGLPAVGKTTLAQELANEYSFRIVKTGNKFELIFTNIFLLFKKPLLSITNFILIIKNSDSFSLWKYKILNCWLHNNSKNYKAQHIDRAIIDQGLWQNILSIFEQKIEENDLKKYLDKLPQPNLLVIFDLDTDIWEERINKRGYFARGQFSEKKVMEWKKIMLANFELLKQVIATTKVPYVILDSSKPLAEQVSIINSRIDQ